MITGEYLREGKRWQSNSRVIQINKFSHTDKCFVMIKSALQIFPYILMNNSTGNSSHPKIYCLCVQWPCHFRETRDAK